MASQEFPLAESLRRSLPENSAVTVHDDGSIEYRATDKPPTDINGYERDADNPLLFRPLWPVCMKRLCGVNQNKGSVQVQMICVHAEQKKYFMRRVPAEVCQACPLQVKPK
jgi:hypothetical protein